MFLWRYHYILTKLNKYRKEVACRPIEAHACRHETPKEKRNADGYAVCDHLLRTGLFVLKRIEDILRVAKKPCGRPGEKRHKPGNPAIGPWHTGYERFCGTRNRKPVANPVDDFDKSHEDHDLNGKRHERKHGMISFAFEQGCGLFPDRITIPIMFHLDAVRRRHERYHLKAVHLAPQRNRELKHLGEERENDDVSPPVWTPLVAPIHKPCKKLYDIFHCQLSISVIIFLNGIRRESTSCARW